MRIGPSLTHARSHLLNDFRSYFVVVFFSGFTSLLSFLTAAILARELGPARFGEFALFYAMLQIFWTATNFGDATYVRYVTTEGVDDSVPYLRATFFIELATAALLGALAYPLALLLAELVFDDGGVALPVFFGILGGTGLNLVSLVAAVHQAREQFWNYAVLNMLFYGVSAAGVAVLAFASTAFELRSVYLLYLGASGLVFAASFWRLYRLTRPMQLERKLIGTLLSFGKWLIAGNLTYLLYQRTDIFLIARYASEYDVGQYGAALRIAVIASLLTGSVAPFLLPRASRTRGSRQALRQYVRQAARLTAGVVAFIGCLILAAPVLIRLLFGETYLPAVGPTRLLLVGSALIAVYTPLSQLFLAEDTPRRRLYLGLVKLSTTIALLVLLVPAHGAVGGAWSVVGAESASLLYTLGALAPTLRNAR